MNNLLRKIDLTSLRLFVAVCQEKNIARAAEREFIAPSAVSRRITEIEAIIGLPVIQRQSRNFPGRSGPGQRHRGGTGVLRGVAAALCGLGREGPGFTPYAPNA